MTLQRGRRWMQGSDGQIIGVPRGWRVAEGPDGRLVSFKKTERTVHDTDGRLIRVPEGWAWSKDGQGRVTVAPITERVAEVAVPAVRLRRKPPGEEVSRIRVAELSQFYGPELMTIARPDWTEHRRIIDTSRALLRLSWELLASRTFDPVENQETFGRHPPLLVKQAA